MALTMLEASTLSKIKVNPPLGDYPLPPFQKTPTNGHFSDHQGIFRLVMLYMVLTMLEASTLIKIEVNSNPPYRGLAS